MDQLGANEEEGEGNVPVERTLREERKRWLGGQRDGLGSPYILWFDLDQLPIRSSALRPGGRHLPRRIGHNVLRLAFFGTLVGLKMPPRLRCPCVKVVLAETRQSNGFKQS